MPNLFSEIPENISEEIFEDIISTEGVRIERILSHGQSSPETGWYDQAENEWVIVLKGQGVIEFKTGQIVTLSKGDYVNIKAGEKHRVISTSSQEVTVWLAVFYK
ncbi:TPA: cupin domain-containing protein [Vibrio parahaemolyticus]|uniref:Cupin 2 domain-containing protein n=1 Tax=Vibrio xiamenensis TaxID=861298 RepID=A0A1G8FGM0_9VIBR|nr:cupin domain-containing protein [Vibrio xiamenensis]SDH81196.1 cupin 2 domain-containing protein [Vibrio xiamenensis]